MTRRRPTFGQYLRRRWRAVGLVVVLLLGALLVVFVTDRGHDPEWDVRTSVVEDMAFSADGRVVYLLAREGGNISRLEARAGDDGALLWQSPLSASRALVRAAQGEVAVATDFPRAFLTVFGEDGSPRYQFPLEGNPRALGVEGGVVALALQAPENPVFVIEDGRVVREHRFPSVANAIDLRAGRLAVGTVAGQLVVFDPDGARLVNASLPLSVRSVRFTSDASSVVVGGADAQGVSLGGAVAMVDVDAPHPLRWSRATPQTVGLVDVDAEGGSVLAVESSPPARLHLLEPRDGRVRWTRDVEGAIPRDDAGAFGGAALSPDGSSVVAVTLSGPVTAYDARTGAQQWTYGSEGATLVAFARDQPAVFVTNARLVPNGPTDALLLFSAHAEPTLGRLPLVAAALTALAAVVTVTLLGVGFWRVRRSW